MANTAAEDDDGFAGYVSTKPICGLAQVYPDDPRNEKGNQIGILPCLAVEMLKQAGKSRRRRLNATSLMSTSGLRTSLTRTRMR